MIKNYIKIAWRNILHNKGYSFINISGLSIGLAIVILISCWIRDELMYNRNFPHYDQLVKVMQNSTHNNAVNSFLSLPIPLSAELRTRYGADLRQVAMASWNDSHTLAFGDKRLNQTGMFAQPELTDMLSLNMLYGSREALTDPSSILISRSLATALFGQTDPTGKTIRVDNKSNLKIGGVFEDFPYNCDFRETAWLGSWSFYLTDQGLKTAETDWKNNGFLLFARLQDQVSIPALNARIRGALSGHGRQDKPEVMLHPMSRWHLYDSFKNGKNEGGAIQFVWMFGIIGIFVLLLACINFMNLSTARSEKRAKEVGIRKSVGSLRSHLVLQFLGESILIAFLSFTIAIILVWLSLPWFNQLADKQMSMPWGQTWFWLPALGLTLITGLIAGSYPAFYLSSFSAVKVLKGTFKVGRLAALPRQILIVLQFSVSISLIIGTIIVFQQIQYVKDRSAGYSRDGLLTVNINTTDLQQHYRAIRDDLVHSGAALDVAGSSSPTTSINLTQSSFSWTGKNPNMLPSFVVMFVSHDFGRTIGWQLQDGRDFSGDIASDSTGMILNEAAAKYMGLRHATGESVQYLRSKRTDQRYRVLGVIRDMVMESPFAPVQPTIFMIDYTQTSVCLVKVNPALPMSQALPRIAAVMRKYSPGSPFDYTFTDNDYAKKFNLEERVSHLATFFAIFAIFISCMGLSGLASFMAEQRTKEIGIRKILGASVLHLWGRLSASFFLLIFISFLIALPLSWYGMHSWLEQYDYRATISPWIFIITLLLALGITILTVSFQSIRSARANPARSLRWGG